MKTVLIFGIMYGRIFCDIKVWRILEDDAIVNENHTHSTMFDHVPIPRGAAQILDAKVREGVMLRACISSASV